MKITFNHVEHVLLGAVIALAGVGVYQNIYRLEIQR
jgi:hypothetical protein